jgi:hypothetical protein
MSYDVRSTLSDESEYCARRRRVPIWGGWKIGQKLLRLRFQTGNGVEMVINSHSLSAASDGLRLVLKMRR